MISGLKLLDLQQPRALSHRPISPRRQSKSEPEAVLDAIIKALDTAKAAADVDVEAACGATQDKAMKEMIEAEPR
jgi:hypothetical protein